jgi:hypothetical protein
MFLKSNTGARGILASKDVERNHAMVVESLELPVKDLENVLIACDPGEPLEPGDQRYLIGVIMGTNIGPYIVIFGCNASRALAFLKLASDWIVFVIDWYRSAGCDRRLM